MEITSQVVMTNYVTESIAQSICEIVDHGLVAGIGVPVRGKCCVEAAVCLAMNIEHDDRPPTVGDKVRTLKITLNDLMWSSTKTRGAGLKRLAVAQLGSAALNQKEFVSRVRMVIIQRLVPRAYRAIASINRNKYTSQPSGPAQSLHVFAAELERYRSNFDVLQTFKESLKVVDYPVIGEMIFRRLICGLFYTDRLDHLTPSAINLVNAVHDIDRCLCEAGVTPRGDALFAEFAEIVVQVLIDMKSPGCQWLPPLVIDKSPWVGHYDK